MARNTIAHSCHNASASSYAEAGFARSSCTDKKIAALGISLLVSIFVIFLALCQAAWLVNLVYIIINVSVLILIIGAIISITSCRMQEQNACIC